jgi:hypothetical protein
MMLVTPPSSNANHRCAIPARALWAVVVASTVFVAAHSSAEMPGPAGASQLDRKVAQQANAISQKSVEAQMTALEHSDQALAISDELGRRLDLKLVSLTTELRAEALADARKPQQTGPMQKSSHDDPHRGRIEIGSLALEPQTLSEEKGRYRFDRPFARTPRVVLGMRDSPQTRSEQTHVALRVVHVDPEGFDYEIRRSGSAPVQDLTADWVAYANGRAAGRLGVAHH